MKKRRFPLYAFSLIVSLFLCVCLLTVFCIRLLRQNYIENLNAVTAQVADNFERRIGNTRTQLFNRINMFQLPDYMQRLDEEGEAYAVQELRYMTNQLVSESSPFDFVYVRTDGGYSVDTEQKLDEGGQEAVAFSQAFLERAGKEALTTNGVWASDQGNRVYLLYSVRGISSLHHAGHVVARIRPRDMRLLQREGNSLAMVFYNRDRFCIYTEGVSDGLRRELTEQLGEAGIADGDYSWDGKTYHAVRLYGADGWQIVGLTDMAGILRMGRNVIAVGFLLSLILIILSHVLNRMNRQIEVLADRLLNEERLKSQAELEKLEYRYRFLQAQINPHFIYNALEAVNALAKINHVPEISRPIQLIGKYFRSMTAYSDHQFIPLGEAMESVRIYMEIYRYMQSFELRTEIICPPDLADEKIPTMILQPIVENCFVHGECPAGEIFSIRVEASCRAGKLRLSIRDNGRGFSAEETAGGEQGVRKKRGAHSGIGLANIRERLAMLYADRAVLSFFGGPEGAEVVILIPLCSVQETAQVLTNPAS